LVSGLSHHPRAAARQAPFAEREVRFTVATERETNFTLG